MILNEKKEKRTVSKISLICLPFIYFYLGMIHSQLFFSALNSRTNSSMNLSLFIIWLKKKPLAHLDEDVEDTECFSTVTELFPAR